jgi:sugar O-acyltransferase (sialic acid O-acetyltransferase NeuD family)
MTPSVSSPAKLIYLVGCGGHGRVVLDTLLTCGTPVEGIIDAGLARGARVVGVAVLGGDECLAQLEPKAAALCIGVGVMPGKGRRAELFASLQNRGFEFVAVAHPSAVIAARTRLGAGVQVLAGAVLQTGVSLGDNVIVNTRASVDHDCVIERDVMIGPGAVLCGEVGVAQAAYIGAGAVLMPGVRVGAQAVIGAGSVVTGNVPAGATLVGNPARDSRLAERRDA